MKNTDFIDMSNGVQPFEGLVPAFGEQMGEEYMTGKREGATDYLEVVDCEAVKDYIAENVPTPEHEGEFASFDGFITETALKEEESEEPEDDESTGGGAGMPEEEEEEPKEEEKETEEPKGEEPLEPEGPTDGPQEQAEPEEPLNTENGQE